MVEHNSSVLIVDDNKVNRLLLSRSVELLGHRVALADNGRVALDRLRSEPFDLLLLDIEMPELDGFAVLEQLKADPQLRDVPVIVISSVEGLDNIVRCIDLGAEDYLPKPVNQVLLRARIGASLEKKRLRLAEIALLHDKNWQLTEASQHKSRFLAAASHDLRQPMHALGLFVAQLRGHITSPEGSRLVDCIDDAIAGMNELFNTLLDITKLDAGALTPTIAEFPVAELLRRIESTFAAVAQEKGLSLRLASTSAWVRSDPVLLERIVLNLVSNAVHYTTSGGIVVGCRRGGALLRIDVADSGPGIPDDQRRKIFGEFYRLADAAKTNQAGLGLGLAIVERLCALLDHPIELKSTPGKGSRFSIAVPRARAAGVAKSEPSRQAVIDVPSRKLVVVMDHDARILEGMGGLLRDWGCCVVIAATSEAALTEVKRLGREARPDLIISDYHLADGQSGITAIAKLREAHGAIPAFVMSGDTAPERLREARDSGLHLLHKPVQPITLRAMVNRFLKSGHDE
jgi:two-component system, sensor histidine kinase